MSLSYAHSKPVYAADWEALLLQDDGVREDGGRSLHAGLLQLLTLLGWKGDAHQLAEILGGMPRSIGVQEFRNILAELGYRTRLRRGQLELARGPRIPCVFMPDDRALPAILVTEEMAEPRYSNLRSPSIALTLSPAIKGQLMTCEPLEHADVVAPPNRWFNFTLRRFRALFRQVLLLGFLINAISLGVPFFSMMVYDHVIGVRDLNVLWFLLTGVTIAFAAETLFRLMRSSALAWFSARLNFLAAQAVFERLLALEPQLVEQASPAAQVARIKTFESVREFFSGQAFLLFVEMPFLLVLLFALACLSGTMAAVCVGVGVVFFVLAMTQLRTIRAASQRSARTLSERQRDTMELVTKLRVLRLNGLERVILARLLELTRKSLRRSTNVTHQLKRVEHLATSLTLLGGLVAISLGVQDVWRGSLSPGGLIAGMILVWRTLSPFQQLATVAPRLEQVQGGIQQIERLLVLPVERTLTTPLARAYDFKGEIEVVNLAMRYPKQIDPVFSGLNLHVQPGKIIAVAGSNGSGKSSLLKLVNGLYRPVAGTIRVDGVDLRQFDALSLRRSITYVSQTADLFTGTLRENLTMAAPFANEDAVRTALIDAGAFEDVMTLSDGLETMVHADAIELPPMLPFTLNLARAYLTCKRVLLVDELPYAVLAGLAGERFRAKIASMRGTHTVLMVAHTADLIAMADQVVLFQQEQRPKLLPPQEAIKQLREISDVA